MKWFWIVLLIVVGIVAAVFGYEYLSHGIGHLPSWVPGGHPGKHGHERKRGYLSILIAIAAFAGAGWLIYKDRRDAEQSGDQGTAAAA